MNKMNSSALNSHTLSTFLAVLEVGSVSRAAEKLEISQSAVSHIIDKLRVIFNDPLFVRSGRTIVPTERAMSLKPSVEAILSDLSLLTSSEYFLPSDKTLTFSICANDFQRDLIFPSLLLQARNEGVDLRLKFSASGVPGISEVRGAECDIMITPFPPNGSDVFQVKLFDDDIVCFYDQQCREAPLNIDDLVQSDFVAVQVGNQKNSIEAIVDNSFVKLPPPVITVQDFQALARFIEGGKLITISNRRQNLSTLRNLSTAPLPFHIKPISMYMVWHKVHHNDAAHRWLREKIKDMIPTVLDVTRAL